MWGLGYSFISSETYHFWCFWFVQSAYIFNVIYPAWQRVSLTASSPLSFTGIRSKAGEPHLLQGLLVVYACAFSHDSLRIFYKPPYNQENYAHFWRISPFLIGFTISLTFLVCHGYCSLRQWKGTVVRNKGRSGAFCREPLHTCISSQVFHFSPSLRTSYRGEINLFVLSVCKHSNGETKGVFRHKYWW